MPAKAAGAVEYANCISIEGWVRLNKYSGHDTKPFDGEVLVLELLWMWSIPSDTKCKGPIYRSNQTVQSFTIVETI